MISIHTQTHEKRWWRRRWNTHRHTKMKILAEKIVKKIRSSISRPHRTQFPLVHINIHTHNRHVSPRSHLYDYLTHTHTPTLVQPRAYGCCHGNLLCCEANGEERVPRAASAAAAYYNWESASPRSTPVETNTFAHSPPPVVVVHTHDHIHTHIHTQVHSHTPVAHFRSS